MLSYPLNTKHILRKKKSIKKGLLQKNKAFVEKNIAILGGSTTNEIKDILELFLLNSGIKPNFYESEYNKYYEDALFYDFADFKPDIIYIHTTNRNITKFANPTNTKKEVKKLISDEFEKHNSIWEKLAKYNCAIIQNNFEYPKERCLGNLDNYDYRGKTYLINKLNAKFAKKASKIKHLYIHDINYLSSYIGLNAWHDKSLWHQAKYAMSLDSIVELSSNLSKIIKAIFGKTKKCLVLDLDNTCWGGVIGDDGLDGIKLGSETAISEVYTSFQEFVKEFKDRGITLAVCSKNDFKNAKEGFSHPDSVLKFEDFTSFKANWEPKHINIENIAKEINIGLDSLVFIDDNPAEREIVTSYIPNVSVPNVGDNPIDFITHIDKNGFFEPISLSNDDINRNQYYEDNKKREAEQNTFSSYGDFLKSLDMTAQIDTFKPIYLDRITQLTNKTNQFNLTTKRYTFGEIEKIKNDDSFIKLYGKLTDKFGDNGLISVVIGEIKENKCHILLWLMSCRVLKRDMEFAMLDKLVDNCKQKNIFNIIGYYYKTQKNAMVENLYGDFGFKKIKHDENHSIWELDIRNYEEKNKFIKISEDK